MESTEQSKLERVTSERPNGGKGSCGTVQSETEERDFVTNLYRFMKERGTPIERIPHLGFKQINLWKIYSIVEGLGGYHSVTARRLWKSVYDELGGSPGSTSAATCTRRHYERLVLPFERQLRGEADKPLPPPKPRRPYRKSQEAGAAHAHSKRKRKPPSPDAQPQSGVYEQCCETGACRPSCPWYDRSCADHPEGRPETQSASDPTSATSACLAPVTPAEVISPLEKKKRVAQASLSAHPPAAPPHVPEDPAERPSVIRLPAPRPRQVSEGSPLPLSSASSVSFSRSPSPYSMSSEDSVTVSTTTTDVSKKGPPPASSAAPPDSPPTPGGSTGICRPLSRYPIAKETARGLHCREVVQVGPLPRATSRHPALKLPLPTAVYPPHPGPNWVPDASGFAALPLRDSWRITTATLHHPPYKHPLQPPHRQPAAADEALAFGRKLHVVPPFRQTDRRARGKPPPAPKPVLAQHPLLLPPITPGFLRGGAGGGEAKHPLHPAFLSAPPLPHGFPLRRLAPTGLYPAAYEPATTLYPCPSHLWHPHPAYSIAGFQPYYPSARL